MPSASAGIRADSPTPSSRRLAGERPKKLHTLKNVIPTDSFLQHTKLQILISIQLEQWFMVWCSRVEHADWSAASNLISDLHVIREE